jgi:hypothetical protein
MHPGANGWRCYLYWEMLKEIKCLLNYGILLVFGGICHLGSFDSLAQETGITPNMGLHLMDCSRVVMNI